MFGVFKSYSKTIQVLLSVLSLYTIHILVLREHLLGALSPLSDAIFFVDVSTDIAVAAILAVFAARATFFFTFTGFIGDQIGLAQKVFGWISQKIGSDLGRPLSHWEEKAAETLKENQFWIEASATVIYFVVFYIGTPSSIIGFLFAVVSIALVLVLLFQVLGHFNISLKDVVAPQKMVSDSKRLSVFVSILSLFLFFVSVILAVERAESLAGRNIVAMREARSDLHICVSVLAKSSEGLFIRNYFSTNDLTLFIPYQRISEVYEIGGGELPWMPEYEVQDCEDYGTYDFERKRT